MLFVVGGSSYQEVTPPEHDGGSEEAYLGAELAPLARLAREEAARPKVPAGAGDGPPMPTQQSAEEPLVETWLGRKAKAVWEASQGGWDPTPAPPVHVRRREHARRTSMRHKSSTQKQRLVVGPWQPKFLPQLRSPLAFMMLLALLLTTIVTVTAMPAAALPTAATAYGWAAVHHAAHVEHLVPGVVLNLCCAFSSLCPW